jgi:uncharacterized cupredoxin-like copper-binding protein
MLKIIRKPLSWVVLALAVVLLLVKPVWSQNPPEVREYWFKAEEILWDYAPSYPTNAMMAEPFIEDQLVFVESAPDRIGRIYKKAVYRAYTPNFETVIDGPNEVTDLATGQLRIIRKPGSREEHLGFLGPIIRAEVGDTIVIHFKNETQFNLSLHAHGVFYDKANEGTPYADGTSATDKADDALSPGTSYTYTWQVPERSGPGPSDPDSIIWPYHSHTDEVQDTNAGLVGAIIIHKRGTLNQRTDLPKGIDREFVNLFAVTDENSSLYLESNIEQFTTAVIDLEDEDFIESNLMHGINGFLYADLPGLTMKQGEKVRWYMLAMGTEVDIHTPHWHGVDLLENGRRVDITEIFPASAKTLDMVADDPGVWMYHCHVNDHLDAGMQALFTIAPNGT